MDFIEKVLGQNNKTNSKQQTANSKQQNL